MWNANDFVGKEFGMEKGVEFINLPKDEIAKWKAAVEPVIDSYVKSMVGKGYAEAEVRSWIKFLRDRIDYWTEKQIQWRIPSAAGPPELSPQALLK